MGICSFIARRFRQRCDRAGAMTRRLARKLRLDGQQQQKLDAVEQQLRELRSGARSGLTGERGVFAALLGDRFDRDAALHAAREPLALFQEALPRLVGAVGDFHDQLSAEQRVRLRELLGHRCGGHCCAG